MGNADLLPNKSRLTNSTRQSRCALWQEEREQLKTRASLKYSFDFFENQVLGAVFFLLLLFVSSSAHRMLKLEQNYHNTRQNPECQVCYVDSVWVTQWGGCYFPRSQSVCLFVRACVCACMLVHACMSAYCALCLETYPVKACLR